MMSGFKRIVFIEQDADIVIMLYRDEITKMIRRIALQK